MTLEMKAGAADTFARRPIQGAPTGASSQAPDQLLLDGQQRMTSLYQTCVRKELVETITPRQKLVKRWFYIDIEKALRSDVDREDAIGRAIADAFAWSHTAYYHSAVVLAGSVVR